MTYPYYNTKYTDQFTGKDYDSLLDIPSWFTCECPRGHRGVYVMEDRLRSSTNRGIYCWKCNNMFRCDTCGHETHEKGQGILWVGSMELERLGLISKGNWRDGGAYAICPKCPASRMEKMYRSSWYSYEELVKDGGIDHRKTATLDGLMSRLD